MAHVKSNGPLHKEDKTTSHCHTTETAKCESGNLGFYVNGVTEGFSTFERFEHSTGTRRFNYRLTGGN